jgi:hypothetical protein
MTINSIAKNNVTVHVTVEDNKEGTATLILYACDRNLMDAQATLVSQAPFQQKNVPSVVLPVPDDLSQIQQMGKNWDQMVEPTLYVSLDTANTAATLTYASGPVFNVQPGQTVEMKLKEKTNLC